MDGNAAVRLGGISGILYVLLFLPAYIVGYPDALNPASSAQEVFDYFSVGRDTFLFFNGTLSIFAVFFFLWFLGILHGLLRRAEGKGIGLSSVALAGGAMFATLSWAGVATEISIPATLGRFANFQEDAQLVFLTLALSSWLYHFCQIGIAALVTATSLVAFRTGILPTWLSWAGLVVALLSLLHFLIPLLGALIGMLWVAVVSVVMLTGSVGHLPIPTRRLARGG